LRRREEEEKVEEEADGAYLAKPTIQVVAMNSNDQAEVESVEMLRLEASIFAPHTIHAGEQVTCRVSLTNNPEAEAEGGGNVGEMRVAFQFFAEGRFAGRVEISNSAFSGGNSVGGYGDDNDSGLVSPQLLRGPVVVINDGANNVNVDSKLKRDRENDGGGGGVFDGPQTNKKLSGTE